MTEIPKPGGVQWLAGPNGSTFIVANGGTTPAELHTEMALAFLGANGFDIEDPDVIAVARRKGAEEERHLLANARARGLSHRLKKLFRATKKQEAEKCAKALSLTSQAFHDLVYLCLQLGLKHESKHYEFAPESCQLSPEDHDALTSGENADTARAKTKTFFLQRQHRSVHVFSGANGVWHIIYMTFRDIGTDPMTGKNHWKHGPHYHYLSHLLTSMPLDKVLTVLSERKASLPSLHIALIAKPAERPDGESPRSHLVARHGKVVKVDV